MNIKKTKSDKMLITKCDIYFYSKSNISKNEYKESLKRIFKNSKKLEKIV